jgi:hypothetical protein
MLLGGFTQKMNIRCAFQHVFKSTQMFKESHIPTFCLTFFLAFFLTYTLTFYLAFYFLVSVRAHAELAMSFWHSAHKLADK